MSPSTTTNPEISAVIPTLGRASKLERSLRAFEDLDPATPPFEVVVALDGEDAESRRVAAAPRPFPVTVVSHAPSGTGPTRNLGGEAARGELILFLNDDTRPHPRCLLTHAEAQRRLGPAIVLGRVEWEPEREVTPYMAWLAPAGHQFNYERLEPWGRISWDACWGTNLSVPRAWLMEEPFPRDFPIPATEDTAWGYLQHRRGRPLFHVPEAVLFHDHRYEGPRDYEARIRHAGRGAREIIRRHPELVWKLGLRPLLAAAVAGLRALRPGRRGRPETAWDLHYRRGYLRWLLGFGRP